MAKVSNTIATLLAGAAVGVAVGYILATDKEKRQEDLGKIKDRLNDLKDKYARKGANNVSADHVEDIYHT